MDTFTIEPAEGVRITATRLPREPERRKWLKALLSLIPYKLLKQDLKWRPPDGWHIRIEEPFSVSEYKILADECTPATVAITGLDHKAWQSKAWNYAFNARDLREGFARVQVSVPDNFWAVAFPRTPLNALIEFVGERWWWLQVINLQTKEETVFIADPGICTPDSILADGEHPNRFAGETLGQGATKSRPLSEDPVQVEQRRKKLREEREREKSLPPSPVDILKNTTHPPRGVPGKIQPTSRFEDDIEENKDKDNTFAN